MLSYSLESHQTFYPRSGASINLRLKVKWYLATPILGKIYPTRP
jgi:hypothetical protein